jgi:pSer/pThr/pTyr-binding forkhead associated (FHA) protein
MPSVCPHCGNPVTATMRNCPRCRGRLVDDEAAREVIEGTRLESVDEVRQALKAKSGSVGKEVGAEDDATPFRPSRRPPIALLCILDDGREDGEWVRLRTSRVVIGRTDGDIRIPHDDMISGRHAEVTRQSDQGRVRWYLTDLQSTNGTFVRIGKAQLRHGQEFLLGSRRFRFDAAPPGAEALEGAADDEKPKATRGWKAVAPSDLLPSLVELTPAGEGERLLLSQPDNRIGRGRQCTLVLEGDLLLSPVHARIFRDAKERWQLENCNALNGTWIRITKVPLEGTGQFQLGEQRFLIKVL